MNCNGKINGQSHIFVFEHLRSFRKHLPLSHIKKIFCDNMNGGYIFNSKPALPYMSMHFGNLEEPQFQQLLEVVGSNLIDPRKCYWKQLGQTLGVPDDELANNYHRGVQTRSRAKILLTIVRDKGIRKNEVVDALVAQFGREIIFLASL